MNRCFDISGLVVRFTGLPDTIAERFVDAWPLFERRDPGQIFLDVHVSVEGEPVPDGTVDGKSMRTTFEEQSARFSMKGGSALASEAGRFEVRLAPSGASTQFIALLNFTLAGLAWRMSRAGGAIVHAAGILLGERAVILVGPSGSGKSTWVRLAIEAGARNIGDDLVLLDGSGGRIEVLGTPLRSRRFGSPGPGRWPLAAALLPCHGATASLDPADPRILHARVVANLPWVADAMCPALTRFVDTLIAGVPFRTLTFAEDASFVPVIERFLDSEAGHGTR